MSNIKIDYKKVTEKNDLMKEFNKHKKRSKKMSTLWIWGVTIAIIGIMTRVNWVAYAGMVIMVAAILLQYYFEAKVRGVARMYGKVEKEMVKSDGQA